MSRRFAFRNVVGARIGAAGALARSGLFLALVSWTTAGVELTAAELLSGGATWSFFKGTEEPTGSAGAWRESGFDDSSWGRGPAPIRYGDGEGGTVLDDMAGNYGSVYLRTEFEVKDPEDIDVIGLSVDYDDGFVVWLNGIEILAVNAPANVAHDAFASAAHESGTPELFRVDDAAIHLVRGVNVFAVQVFNKKIDSTDLHFEIEISDSLFVGDTKFSVNRGFFSDAFDLELTSKTTGAEIRYTTDGSWPSERRGKVYDAPITIDTTTVVRALAYRDDLEPTNVDTQTYIFIDDVLEQPDDPEGLPTTWTAARHRDSSSDYEMDRNVVRDSDYRDEMPEALLALPTLSIAVDPDDMFGSDGIYNNGSGTEGNNSDWESPISLELIHPDGSKGFQVNCGIRPHSHVGKKRSFKVLFKGEYGPKKLRYPLFDTAVFHGDSAVQEFDRLVLRAGFNRSWGQSYNLEDTVYVRDQWVRDSQIEMSGAGARGVFVHLYINGLYWGLYNPSERPDSWFASAYFGGDKEDHYSVNHGGDLNGDPAVFKRIDSLAQESKLDRESKYEELTDLLDVALYADYLLLNWFAGTGDWPKNNWYGGNQSNPEGKFRFFVWDAEDCWDDLGSDQEGRSSDGAWIHPAFRTNASSRDLGRSVNARLWRALTENEDFMLLFADRVHRHCFNGGTLTEDIAVERWLALSDHIEEAILGESARWGDAVTEPARTRDDEWEREVRRVAEDSIPGNVKRFIRELRDEGYYPDLDSPTFNTHGGAVVEDFRLRMENPEDSSSEIYYTLDGSDPREAGSGDVADGAEVYDGSIRVRRAVHVKARVRDGSKWSALTEATFYLEQDFQEQLRLTEIMYHPPDLGDVDGDSYEFLELKNTGASILDLSGVHFTDGIDFHFPLGFSLSPGRFVLLVSDRDEFELRYPGVPVSGEFDKNLSNGGESIALAAPAGETFVAVAYDDRAPWPEDADGQGHSLVPISPEPIGNQSNPLTWRPSLRAGGSPGRDDPAPPTDSGVLFIRGDANRDGRVDMSDAITTLFGSFQGRTDLLTCPDATDSNDDGIINLSDPIYSVNFFFIGGPEPSPPYPLPGRDPTLDTLGPCQN